MSTFICDPPDRNWDHEIINDGDTGKCTVLNLADKNHDL